MRGGMEGLQERWLCVEIAAVRELCRACWQESFFLQPMQMLSHLVLDTGGMKVAVWPLRRGGGCTCVGGRMVVRLEGRRGVGMGWMGGVGSRGQSAWLGVVGGEILLLF